MMLYLQIAAGVLAVIVAFWPQVVAAAMFAWSRARMPSLTPPPPSYQSAMLDLANVRLRLVRTASLGKDVAEAVEVLTLALVAGSDK